MAKGYQERDRRAWEARAWMVAYLLQPWSKKPITPADLLKPATDEVEFEKLAGITDPGEAFDTMVRKQEERKAARGS